MTDKITITCKELDRLTRWVNSLPKTPVSILITSDGNNGIGTTLVAYTRYEEEGGEWMQITDYKEW